MVCAFPYGLNSHLDNRGETLGSFLRALFSFRNDRGLAKKLTKHLLKMPNFSESDIPVMTSSHLPTHLAPLTLYPLGLLWGSFQKMPHLFHLSSLRWTSSCDARVSKTWHVSLHCPSSLLSLCPSEFLRLMCLNQQFSHIYPLLSVSRPLFTILCLVPPTAQSGGTKIPNPGHAGRQAAIKHSFEL